MSIITIDEARKHGIPLPGNEPARITQADLEELLYLRRLLDDALEGWLVDRSRTSRSVLDMALKAWAAKREEIRALFDSGAKTEPGVHRPVMVQDEKFRRLEVR